jgi:hypothetical protein
MRKGKFSYKTHVQLAGHIHTALDATESLFDLVVLEKTPVRIRRRAIRLQVQAQSLRGELASLLARDDRGSHRSRPLYYPPDRVLRWLNESACPSGRPTVASGK